MTTQNSGVRGPRGLRDQGGAGSGRGRRPGWSGVIAEGGPDAGPGGAQAGRDVDRRALLVVLDAEAVVVGGDLADDRELAAQHAQVRVDREDAGVPGGL